MRIITGRLGGRRFSSPHGHHTHPMSDKVRGALFSVLGEINGLSVLDAFAGSGAMSFEAISRGAVRAVAIESDDAAQRAISESLSELDLSGQVKLIKASAGSWLSTTDDMFDIVLCDPPYDDPQYKLLTRLAERANEGGLIIYSLPPNSNFKLPSASYRQLYSRTYGDAQIIIFRKRLT